jgi:hypothetical protein
MFDLLDVSIVGFAIPSLMSGWGAARRRRFGAGGAGGREEPPPGDPPGRRSPVRPAPSGAKMSRFQKQRTISIFGS